jgi:hypothetical protein
MRGILALANHTGWPLSEIDQMSTDLFVEFITLIPNGK